MYELGYDLGYWFYNSFNNLLIDSGFSIDEFTLYGFELVIFGVLSTVALFLLILLPFRLFKFLIEVIYNV